MANTTIFKEHLEGDFLLLMDNEFTEEMEFKYHAKLMTRFIQEWRKEIHLIPSDTIEIYYEINNMHKKLSDNKERFFNDISKFLRCKIIDAKHNNYDNIYTKHTSIWNNQCKLYLRLIN